MSLAPLDWQIPWSLTCCLVSFLAAFQTFDSLLYKKFNFLASPLFHLLLFIAAKQTTQNQMAWNNDNIFAVFHESAILTGLSMNISPLPSVCLLRVTWEAAAVCLTLAGWPHWHCWILEWMEYGRTRLHLSFCGLSSFRTLVWAPLHGSWILWEQKIVAARTTVIWLQNWHYMICATFCCLKQVTLLDQIKGLVSSWESNVYAQDGRNGQ